MDQQCRESEGKAKIKGYMSVSDEEAHQRHECEVFKFSDEKKLGGMPLTSLEQRIQC